MRLKEIELQSERLLRKCVSKLLVDLSSQDHVRVMARDDLVFFIHFRTTRCCRATQRDLREDQASDKSKLGFHKANMYFQYVPLLTKYKYKCLQITVARTLQANAFYRRKLFCIAYRNIEQLISRVQAPPLKIAWAKNSETQQKPPVRT